MQIQYTKEFLEREKKLDKAFEKISFTKRIPLTVKERAHILYRDNFQCQRCHSHKQLEIHHQDSNPSNNNIDNLLTLCKSCHVLMEGK